MNGYALTTVEKSCCKTEQVEKPCCKKNESQNNVNSCKKGDCVCAVVTTGFVSALTMPVENHATSFVLIHKKHQFFYAENIFSNVFNAIWLPPKIA
ncbi:MAG TPA: hypothetical protein VLY87_02520 [Flavobacterium sp.]|nr:hypothetical protein [Flavobacterium sp.]